MLTNLDTS